MAVHDYVRTTLTKVHNIRTYVTLVLYLMFFKMSNQQEDSDCILLRKLELCYWLVLRIYDSKIRCTYVRICYINCAFM